jgi:ABC-2 type transport system permease protein
MSSNTIVPLSVYQRLTVHSLFTKSLSDRTTLTLLIGIGVGIMSFLVVAMFPSLEATLAEFDLGPAFDMILGGAGMATPEGWLSTETFSILAPAAIAALAIIDAARSIAGEEEDLSVGLLASNPIGRIKMMFDKSLAIVVHIVVASTLIGLFTWLGVVVIGVDMNPVHAFAAAVHLTALGVMVAGLAALCSTAIGRRVRAMIAAGGIAFIAYMVAVLLPISADLATWAKVSPWHYYWADNPLIHGVNWVDVATLTATGVALFGMAAFVFSRKDLSG